MASDIKADAGEEASHGTLPAGTRLRNYELISVLGQGGFGITYFARDNVLGREVAIKEYLPTSLAIRDNGSMVVPRATQYAEDFIWGRERFLEEARILATLDHVPAVVRVFDFLEAHGTAYMIMALARGDTLEQRLKRDGHLPAPIVDRMLNRLLDGLEEVHKAGFMHRDIKPANIILDGSDNPTLIDFGASRASMADRTAALTAVFTPRYAAAEQLTSDKQGPWTDIYGLSATTYHAILGRPPPSALERALNDRYDPLARQQPAGFALPLLAGIDAGLAVRAKDRPQSIDVWRRQLFAVEDPDDGSTIVRARRQPAGPARTSEPAAPSQGRPVPAPESAPDATRQDVSRQPSQAPNDQPSQGRSGQRSQDHPGPSSESRSPIPSQGRNQSRPERTGPPPAPTSAPELEAPRLAEGELRADAAVPQAARAGAAAPSTGSRSRLALLGSAVAVAIGVAAGGYWAFVAPAPPPEPQTAGRRGGCRGNGSATARRRGSTQGRGRSGGSSEGAGSGAPEGRGGSAGEGGGRGEAEG